MLFCRFGLEEQLTLEDVRNLINRQDLKAEDLLLVNDSTEWKPAREIAVVQPYFAEVEPPARKAADKVAVKRKFVPKFTKPSPAPPTANSEDVKKGIMGLIFIVVGGSFVFSRGRVLFNEFDFEALMMIIVGLAFAAYGVLAIVRPDKVNIGD